MQFAFGANETEVFRFLLTSPDRQLENATLADAPTSKTKAGYLFGDKWDHYITAVDECDKVLLHAEGGLRIDQSLQCNGSPGSNLITTKFNLAKTLTWAHGRQIVSEIMPATFQIPFELEMFEEYLNESSYDGVWALKTGHHQGKGVTVVQAREALRLAKQVPKEDNTDFLIAQKMITDQHFVHKNRASWIRVWVLFGIGENLLRTYMFDGGYLVFGQVLPDNVDPFIQENLQKFVAHVELSSSDDISQTISLMEWRDRLRKETNGNETVFENIWERMKYTVALALAAATPSIRNKNRNISEYHGGLYELLGFDFVISSDMKPWLLEVNTGPSMKKAYSNCTLQKPLPEDEYDLEDDWIECPKDSFTTEKIRYLKAHFNTIQGRWRNLKERDVAARKAVETNRPTGCHVTSSMLREVMDAAVEHQAALENGFQDLTPSLYAALQCISEDKSTCALADVLQKDAEMSSRAKYLQKLLIKKANPDFDQLRLKDLMMAQLYGHSGLSPDSADVHLRHLCSIDPEMLRKEHPLSQRADASPPKVEL